MEREAILEGLNNIRRSVVRLIISFAVLTSASYLFWKDILQFIQSPLGLPLVYYSIPEAFLSTIQVSLFAGVFLSVPFIFKEAWHSIAPFFTPDSKKYSIHVVLTSSFLFYVGAALCFYFLLPAGIKFLLSYETNHIKPAVSVGSYLSFFASFTFAFGFAFEMPLVMLLLGKAGVVSASILAHYRRYAVLIIVTAAAIITPTPDVFNLSLMAGPLYALYELSIILVKVFGKKEKQEALSRK